MRFSGILPYPYDLVVKLLYGRGLRLFECLQLRINHLNFDAMILTVFSHGGKGQKDRAVSIPESILDELRSHIDRVYNLHEKDLKSGCYGAFMFGAFERKSPNDTLWEQPRFNVYSFQQGKFAYYLSGRS